MILVCLLFFFPFSLCSVFPRGNAAGSYIETSPFGEKLSSQVFVRKWKITTWMGGKCKSCHTNILRAYSLAGWSDGLLIGGSWVQRPRRPKKNERPVKLSLISTMRYHACLANGTSLFDLRSISKEQENSHVYHPS